MERRLRPVNGTLRPAVLHRVDVKERDVPARGLPHPGSDVPRNAAARCCARVWPCGPAAKLVLVRTGRRGSSALDAPDHASNPCDQHVQRRDDRVPAWGHVRHLLTELALRDAGELWREHGVGIAVDFQQRCEGARQPVGPRLVPGTAAQPRRYRDRRAGRFARRAAKGWRHGCLGWGCDKWRTAPSERPLPVAEAALLRHVPVVGVDGRPVVG